MAIKLQVIIMRFIYALFILFSFSGAVFALNGGAYNSAPIKRMDISSVNTWFSYDFPLMDEPATGAVITNIYYQYALSKAKVTEGIFFAKLCSKKTLKCIDISDSQSGMTTAFSGEDAKTEFSIMYKLVSHNQIGLIAGNGVTQITVNWAVGE